MFINISMLSKKVKVFASQQTNKNSWSVSVVGNRILSEKIVIILKSIVPVLIKGQIYGLFVFLHTYYCWINFF